MLLAMQTTVLQVANCSRRVMPRCRRLGHRWWSVWWPGCTDCLSMRIAVAVSPQCQRHVVARPRGSAAPWHADIDRQELPVGKQCALAHAANAVLAATATHGRTFAPRRSDEQRHSALPAVCRVERQVDRPEWRNRSPVSSEPTRQRASARLVW